jgi:hypothetical protein
MKANKHEKELNRATKIAENSFSEVFKSMQLLHYTVLYYNFGFDKESIKDFQKNLTSYNNECLDDRDTFLAEEERILNVYRFSCEESAKKFPMRAKMKMIGIKPKRMKDWDVALQNATDAIEVCLVLFLHEFIKVLQPSISDIQLYWSSMVENADLDARGMTDAFVEKYFMDEIELEIKE